MYWSWLCSNPQFCAWFRRPQHWARQAFAGSLPPVYRPFFFCNTQAKEVPNKMMGSCSLAGPVGTRYSRWSYSRYRYIALARSPRKAGKPGLGLYSGPRSAASHPWRCGAYKLEKKMRQCLSIGSEHAMYGEAAIIATTSTLIPPPSRYIHFFEEGHLHQA